MTKVKSKKDRLVKNTIGNPMQSLKALIRSANYLVFIVVSLSLCFEMYMFASWKPDFDYIPYILFQVNLNEPIVVYLLRRQTKVCLLKHLFFPPWTMFSTQTSLVFSRRRPQIRPGCLRSLFKSISPLTILAEKKQNDWAELIQMTHQINPYRVSQIYVNLSKPTISMPILPRFYNSKNDRQEGYDFHSCE